MNGEQDNPGASTDFLVPISVSPAGGYAQNSLQDYMGLPTKVAGYNHIALPLRAYNLIWNEWFRDENLQNSIPVPKGEVQTPSPILFCSVVVSATIILLLRCPGPKRVPL